MSVIGRHTIMSQDFNLQIYTCNHKCVCHTDELWGHCIPVKHFVSNTTNAIVLYNSVKQTVKFPTESEAKMLVPNKFWNGEGHIVKCCLLQFLSRVILAEYF